MTEFSILILGRALIYHNKSALEDLKNDLMISLSPNSKVITDLIPEVKKIIGEPNEIPNLNPNEDKLRFEKTLGIFIDCLARLDKNRTLVLFLDDIQWADSSTLNFISTISSEDTEYGSLFILLAYRDRDTDELESLRSFIQNMTYRENFTSFTVGQLQKSDIIELIYDSFKISGKHASDLAEILIDKASGNPFFIGQLLKHAVEEKFIKYNSEKESWQWQKKQLENLPVQENVVDLLIKYLSFLPQTTQNILTVGAIIGSHFNSRIIRNVLNLNAQIFFKNIIPAINKGYVNVVDSAFPLHNIDNWIFDESENATFGFLHDKFQEAAYKLINKHDLEYYHYKIGLYLQNIEIFSAAYHLNQAHNFYLKNHDRLSLISLNCQAAKEAIKTIAYESAVIYSNTAISLLKQSDWDYNYHVAFDAYYDGAITNYLNFLYDKSGQYISILLDNSNNDDDLLKVYNLKITELAAQAKYDESLAVGFEALTQIGIYLPKPEDPQGLQSEFENKLNEYRRITAIYSTERLLNSQQISDKRMMSALDIFASLADIASVSNTNAMDVIAINGVLLSALHGNSDKSALMYMLLAVIFITKYREYKTGFNLAKLALKLNEKNPSNNSLKARLMVFHGYHINHWLRNPLESFEISEKAFEYATLNSDILYAAYALGIPVQVVFFCAVNLQKSIEVCDKAIDFASKAKMPFIWALSSLIRLLANSLIDQKEGFNSQNFSEVQFIATWNNVPMITTNYYIRKMIALYYSEKRYEASLIAENIYPNISACGGYISIAEFYFYNGLILGEDLILSGHDNENYKRFTDCLQFIENCFNSSKEIFSSLYFILKALSSQISEDWQSSINHLNEAVKYAQNQNFNHYEAIACEMLAISWQKCANDELVTFFIKKSMALYENWGAMIKVNRLKENFKKILDNNLKQKKKLDETGSASTSFKITEIGKHSIDLQTIIQATNALTFERNTEKLIKQLIHIAMLNCGADNAEFIMPRFNKDEYICYNHEGRINDFQEIKNLPKNFIDKVISEKDFILLNDVENSEILIDSSTIFQTRPESILCMPIIKQKEIKGVLYLENTKMKYAFSREHIEFLAIIGANAAHAIENAHIYEDLEARIKARTEELENKNKQIKLILSHINQGILKINSNLEIDSEYSTYLEKILETNNIARRDIIDVVFSKSLLSQEKIDGLRSLLKLLIGDNHTTYLLNKHILPDEVTIKLDSGNIKILTLQWSSIKQKNSEITDSILLSIYDSTLIKKLQKESILDKDRATIISHIILGRKKKVDYIAESCRKLLKNIQSKNLNDKFKFDLHTLKGNARFLGLDFLTKSIHEAENFLAEGGEKDKIEFQISNELAIFSDLISDCSLKIKNFSNHLDNSHYNELLEYVKNQAESDNVAKDLYFKATTCKLDVILTPIVDELIILSNDLNRLPPTVIFDLLDTSIDISYQTKLVDIFTHLFLNAIEHGIESTDQPNSPISTSSLKIWIRQIADSNCIKLHMFDNGQGLDIDKIKKIALNRHLIAPNEQDNNVIASLIFSDNFSTRDTPTLLSGRGVGLKAVQTLLEEVGGNIKILLSEPTKKIGFYTFKYEICLPLSITFFDKSHKISA